MMDTQRIYEQVLVVRSQIGDESAFAELLGLHGPGVRRFVQKMLAGSSASVDDIVQDIWIAIFRGLPRLRDPRRFKPWIFRIARDQIYGEYRKRRAAVELVEIGHETACPIVDFDARMDPEALANGLNGLSAPHREAIVLRYLEEMSYEEISEATSVSVGTVRSRIHYAKLALKEIFQKETL